MNHIYVDASYSPKTKLASIGIPYKKISKKVKAKDSLSAELIAIIVAIEFADSANDIIYSDCLVIIRAIKEKRLIVRHEDLCVHLFTLMAKRKFYNIRWVKRSHPSLQKADKLAREALLCQ